MKSKLNDAELIAEAYAKVEVQEEMLGALAGGIGRAAAGAGKLAGKVAKKGLKAAGTVAKEVGKEAAHVAAEVGAEGAKMAGKAALGAGKAAVKGLDKLGQAADRGISKLASDEEDSGPWPAADHDAPKNGISSRSIEHQEEINKRNSTDKLQAKVNTAKETGGIDKSDASSIMRMHHNIEDQEHAAPVEVDMSQNPAPESLEVSKEVEEEPAVAIVAPSIQPSVEEEPRVNHHDDSEIKMALAELYKIEKYAFALGLMMKETKALEGWTAAKITKAADYLGSVFHKLDYDFHAEAEDHADITPEDHEGH